MLKTELEEAHERLLREFEAYKQQVRELAITTAKEQDWCDSGLAEALEELGLEPMSTRVSARVTVAFEVRGVTKANPGNVDQSFIVDSMVVEDGQIGLDGDWVQDETRLAYISASVTDVEVD